MIPWVRLEAGVEENCYWLGHTDGAEGAFSLFFSKYVRPEWGAGRIFGITGAAVS